MSNIFIEFCSKLSCGVMSLKLSKGTTTIDLGAEKIEKKNQRPSLGENKFTRPCSRNASLREKTTIRKISIVAFPVKKSSVDISTTTPSPDD